MVEGEHRYESRKDKVEMQLVELTTVMGTGKVAEMAVCPGEM